MTTERTKVEIGKRVKDLRSGVEGTINMVHNGQFCVTWDNGMSGSFYSWEQFLSSGGKEVR